MDTNDPRLLVAPWLLTWLALLCFSETEACSLSIWVVLTSTQKKPWEILVFQVFHRCGRKEGQIRFPEKRGFWGKISRLQQPRLSPSEGLDFFPFGFKLITFLSRLTRWKSGKEIRHQGVEPGKGQEWQSGEIYSVLDFQKKLRKIFWRYQSTFTWVYLLCISWWSIKTWIS